MIAAWTDETWQVWPPRKLYVLDGNQLWLHLIQEHHDMALVGHQGWTKTFDLMDWKYDWKNMQKQVNKYIGNSNCCQRFQEIIHMTLGVLWPFSVPERPWDDISMDFIVGFSDCKGFEGMRGVVDRLSKLRHFIPCHIPIDAPGFAAWSLREVVHLHGLPATLVSHQGPQIASVFCGQMCSHMEIEWRMSLAWYCQTDGETVQMNPCIEQCLRVFVNYQQHI